MLAWDQYAVAWSRLHGGYDPRRAGPLVRGWIRFAYLTGSGLARAGIAPTAVTVVGLLLCLAVPAVASGGPGGTVVGGALVLLAAAADALDGAVAVAAERTSKLGYVYDSMADRIGEAAWLAAFWLAGAPGWLVVLGGAVSWLHEYLRARALGAGMKDVGVVTVGERPTRVCVAAVGLVTAGVSGMLSPALGHGTAAVAVVAWLFFALFGLGQLLGAVRRALR